MTKCCLNLNQNTQLEYSFEYVVTKISAILFIPQCINDIHVALSVAVPTVGTKLSDAVRQKHCPPLARFYDLLGYQLDYPKGQFRLPSESGARLNIKMSS